MLLFRQLELIFTARGKNRDRDRRFDATVVGRALRLPILEAATGAVALQSPPPSGPDAVLTSRAKELLRDVGAAAIAGSVRVEWRSRMRSCAGRADYHANHISLNPRLHEHGPDEIDRTLRHELAH
ncbi:MAG: SprT protein, partial [Verrucomicrobiota bacterium]